jgi:hypothetical protein
MRRRFSPISKSARPGNGNAGAALTAFRDLPLHTAGRLCCQAD